MSNSILFRNIFTAAINKLRGVSKKHPASLSWIQKKIRKHTDDISEKNVNVNGLSIKYKHRHTLFHTYPEIFIRGIYNFINQQEHPVIIDCGANIGISTLYFATHYPTANIIAFEPDEENFRLLQDNMQNNKVPDGNIRLIQKAVWIHNEGISFLADGTEGSKISEAATNEHTVLAETQRLKDLFQEYIVVDFLKLDIEGAEYAVLKDCMPELKRVKNLFVEYHGVVEETHKLNEMISILDAIGFSVYITTAADSIMRPFADKKSGNDFEVQLNIFCYRL